MRFGRILAVVAAAAVLVAGGAAGHARRGAERPVNIAPQGPYAVGRAQEQWADRSRTDSLAPLGGTPRVLSTWIWYPAAPGSAGGPPAEYAPGAWAGLHRFGFAETSFDRISTGTRENVPVAPGAFPIVVLLPALGLAAPQYQTIAADLAGRGYVVVGVTPTYSAELTVLSSHPVTASAAGRPADLAGVRGADLVSVWAGDARFAAEQTGVRLNGFVDAQRIVYVGHGFGGAAALEACRTDPHCRGAADLDGVPVHTGSLTAPALLLSAGTGGVASDPAVRPVFATGPRRAFTIAGTEHYAFTDYAAYYLAAPVRRAAPIGPLDGLRALRITGAYLAAFLEATTHGAGWTPPAYPEVHVADLPGD